MPPSASSKRPVLRACAPVNAPFSCPKSSLSINPAGSVPQSTLTKTDLRRPLALWMARATSSFPVPVSPLISTVESVGATLSTAWNTCFIVLLAPTISPTL